jgi:hypothetical protein
MAFSQELTEGEISLIPSYRWRWYETALSTTALDHHQVKKAIQNVYTLLGLELPNIHFCNTFDVLIANGKACFQHPYHCEDGSIFATRILAQIHQLRINFFDCIGRWNGILNAQLRIIDGAEVEYCISERFRESLFKELPVALQTEKQSIYWVFPWFKYANEAGFLDFHFSAVPRTLDFPYDECAWNSYRQLVQTCSWLIATESDCWVCERPMGFHFKEGSSAPAAIFFADGEPSNIEVSPLPDQ